MFLKKIALINYKSFSSISLEFNKKINCFIGDNGRGKTNILDAIYHLAFGKSYSNAISSQNIKHKENFYVIDGIFEKENKEEHLVCSLKKGQKKLIKRNRKAYFKISDHIGLIPLVMISPTDRDLIAEGSEAKRKLIDGIISQLNKNYLALILSYNKILSQRNSLLKFFTANHTFDINALEVYNEQLIKFGSKIYEYRDNFIVEFIPIFQKRHLSITGGKEKVTISYKSDFSEGNFIKILNESLKKDRMRQYTSKGVHKDNLEFLIDGYPIKKFGSQGQQKSFLIALKLAQFDFIKKISNKTPLLLLDDIFDKLDEQRVSHILDLVNTKDFGQIFITDTHKERIENIIQQTKQPYELFKI